MQLGTFPCNICGCCGGEEKIFDDRGADEKHMRCTHCGCDRELRPYKGLTLRLYLNGALTLESLDTAYQVATALGASPDIELKRTETEHKHYFEIPSNVIHARLEIEKVKSDAAEQPKARARSSR